MHDEAIRRVLTAALAMIPVSLAVIALSAPASAQAQAATHAVDDEARLHRIEAFARRYERAIATKDVNAVNACIDLDAVLDTALEGIEMDPGEATEIRRGMQATFDWASAMIGSVGETGHYRFLRAEIEDGRPRALFRLVNVGGGLNYHDLELGATDLRPVDGSESRPPESGDLIITDCRIFLAGENLSDTFRRGIRTALKARHRGEETEGGELVDDYHRFVGLVEGGRFTEALEHYGSMSELLQRDRTMMILRIRAAMNVSIEAIIEATDGYLAAFPDDPGAALYRIDPLIFAERWDEAIAAIEDVRSAVGDDGYLDAMIAGIHTMRRRWDDAARFSEAAIRKDPRLEDPYWTALAASLEREDHARTRTLLLELVRRFDRRFDDLKEYERFEAFTESEEYAPFRREAAAVTAATDS